MLHGMGVETGIDLAALIECSRLAASFVGHDLPSKYLKAHLGKQAGAAVAPRGPARPPKPINRPRGACRSGDFREF